MRVRLPTFRWFGLQFCRKTEGKMSKNVIVEMLPTPEGQQAITQDELFAVLSTYILIAPADTIKVMTVQALIFEPAEIEELDEVRKLYGLGVDDELVLVVLSSDARSGALRGTLEDLSVLLLMAEDLLGETREDFPFHADLH